MKKVDNDNSQSKFSMILNCIRYNYVETLKKLLTPESVVLEQDALHWSYLHYAAYYGNTEIAKLLLQLGLNVNSVDIYKRTALYIAISNQKTEMVDFLVKNKIDILSKDTYDMTPLSYAKMINKFADDELKESSAKIVSILENYEHQVKPVINLNTNQR